MKIFLEYQEIIKLGGNNMVEGYDRFIPVYEATRKLIEEGLEKEGSANVMLDSILADAAALRIPVGPKEEELFIDGLKKYI